MRLLGAVSLATAVSSSRQPFKHWDGAYFFFVLWKQILTKI